MPNCRVCDVELVDGDNWYGKKKKRTYICKTCDVKETRKLRNDKKKRAVEYLGGKCMKCSGEFPAYVFDFHHRDPSEKEGSVGKLCSSSWENIVKELDKCDLLCANCHRIEHHGNDTGEINNE
jgi:hypothetical protein